MYYWIVMLLEKGIQKFKCHYNYKYFYTKD